jgi:hypothetical protein
VFGPFITTQSERVLCCSKWLLRLKEVISKLSPLMKSFCSCSDSLGDANLDMLAVRELRDASSTAFKNRKE